MNRKQKLEKVSSWVSAQTLAQQAFQEPRIRRLDEVVVDADLQCARPILFASGSGHGNDEHATQTGIRAQLSRNLEAIHARQTDVEQHNIRVKPACRFNSGNTVIRERALMAHLFAQHTDGVRGITILFHDQDSRRRRPRGNPRSGVLVHHPLVQRAG